MARVANPYSEGEESDLEDQDYTVVGDGGESSVGSEADTLVPGAVQYVRQTGYPSTRKVKKSEAVKKSVDVNEKPNRKRGRKLIKNNQKLNYWRNPLLTVYISRPPRISSVHRLGKETSPTSTYTSSKWRW